MSSIYFCLADVSGLKLEQNSTIIEQHFILTNSKDDLLQNFINNEDRFINSFGMDTALHDLDNRCFLINTLNDKNLLARNNNMLNGLISTLWQIKDNSVYINNFFYIPDNDNESYGSSSMNIIYYDSEGEIKNSFFTDPELQSMSTLVKKLKPFMSSNEPDWSTENTNNRSIHLAHKARPYNIMTRVERAYHFLNQARKSSLLPLKVTNYISFIECLFSTDTAELQHQVSERVSFFINYHSSDLKKIELYNFIKTCYGIRSTYVHGSELKKSLKLEDLQATCLKLDDYCRKIIKTIIDNNLIVFNEDDKSLKDYFLKLIFS